MGEERIGCGRSRRGVLVVKIDRRRDRCRVSGRGEDDAVRLDEALQERRRERCGSLRPDALAGRFRKRDKSKPKESVVFEEPVTPCLAFVEITRQTPTLFVKGTFP